MLFTLFTGVSGCKTRSLDSGQVRKAFGDFNEQSRPFDVQDLAILFPRQQNGRFYPEIGLTGLITQPLFDAVINEALNGPTAVDRVGRSGQHRISFRGQENQISNWVVVGVRVIPCVLTRMTAVQSEFESVSGKATGFPPGCVPQIRLVAQPLQQVGSNDNQQFRDIDVALHLVYSLAVIPPAADFPAFVSTFQGAVASRQGGFAATRVFDFVQSGAGSPSQNPLLTLKSGTESLGVTTSGAPLGVHVGLLTELNNSGGAQPGALAQIVQSVLQPLVPQAPAATSPLFLTNLSFMGLNNGGPEPWIFFGGTVDPLPTERDPQNLSNLTYNLKSAFPGTDQSDAAVALSFLDNTNVLPAPPANGFVSTAALFNAQDDNAAVSLRVDNPSLIHNFNTDCVSCHTTTTRMVRFGADQSGLAQGNVSGNLFSIPHGITSLVHPDALPTNVWNIRNFGYFGGRPAVSTRTLAEAVDAAQLANDIFAAEDSRPTSGPGNEATTAAGPGLSCDDPQAAFARMLSQEKDCATLFGIGAAENDKPSRKGNCNVVANGRGLRLVEGFGTDAVTLSAVRAQCQTLVAGRSAPASTIGSGDSDRDLIVFGEEESCVLSRVFAANVNFFLRLADSSVERVRLTCNAGDSCTLGAAASDKRQEIREALMSSGGATFEPENRGALRLLSISVVGNQLSIPLEIGTTSRAFNCTVAGDRSLACQFAAR